MLVLARGLQKIEQAGAVDASRDSSAVRARHAVLMFVLSETLVLRAARYSAG